MLLGLAAVGLVLPIWPTTPFVLLAAACFSCTPGLKARIMGIAFFREHMENYQHRTGLKRRTLAISLGYLWGMLILSMVLMQELWLTLLLLAVGAAVTVHLFWMARLTKPHEPD